MTDPDVPPPNRSPRLIPHRRKDQSPAEGTPEPWPVLVVDDEADIHTMTRILLRDFSFQGRPFEVISAYSAAEARLALARRPDIPVMLLDVVMETPEAGLTLVRHVREDLGNRRMAIVLRTGQPGEAPEREVMLAYDINDYRNKAELTAQKLFTALVGGVRSWINLTAFESLSRSLEQRVADRTRALDDALRFSEDLVEHLPLPVWVADGSGRLCLYNRAFRELFGIDAEDGLGRPVADLLPAAAAAQPADRIEATLDLASGRREVIIGLGRLDQTAFGRGAHERRGGTIGTITDISERKQMERRLFDLATRDGLTGALNRRAFFDAAEQEIDRAVRTGMTISVLMIDLDHFKTINDRFGHAIGDRALKLATATMAASLREVDRLGRLGGEEFAVLMPQTPIDGAIEAAERLCRAIAAQELPLAPDQPPLTLTASLGVAEWRVGDIGPDPMLVRADAALYRAKTGGRNRVAW